MTEPGSVGVAQTDLHAAEMARTQKNKVGRFRPALQKMHHETPLEIVLIFWIRRHALTGNGIPPRSPESQTRPLPRRTPRRLVRRLVESRRRLRRRQSWFRSRRLDRLPLGRQVDFAQQGDQYRECSGRVRVHDARCSSRRCVLLSPPNGCICGAILTRSVCGQFSKSKAQRFNVSSPPKMNPRPSRSLREQS